VTKNLVFGCAAALLMAGSAVTALPDVQAGEVLVAGNHGNHGHKGQQQETQKQQRQQVRGQKQRQQRCP
jgi:Spy/CpxP family protein refolding chaperone